MGKLYNIGANKAFVVLDGVHARRAKVPFQKSDWGEGRLTLGKLLDTHGQNIEFSLNFSQIHKPVSEEATTSAGNANYASGCKNFILSLE